MGRYDVAAYFVPSYTGDEPRSMTWWPEGYGEWEIIQNAVRKFPGHSWPRRPAWGYTNDADPYVMAMHIDAAADHGVNVFIYDWYWFDGRPYQEQPLNDGILKAKNRERVKFYLMWANHDATNMYDLRNSHYPDNVIWKGAVDRAEFERVARRWIENYFHLPNYYRIDGKPVLMIYDVPNLARGLGGASRTRAVLDWFRDEAVRAGLPGLHLQMTFWSQDVTINRSGVDGGKDLPAYDTITALGFDSITHYQFVHFTDTARAYPAILADVRREWADIDAKSPVPYFPGISLGWDNNPRYKHITGGIMLENTPANIEEGLRMAKAYADSHPGQPPLITINAWNEWPESSYLAPDNLNGYGYLQAVKRVFGAST